MKKYNYLYIITNKTNKKIYVGVHSTDNLDDGYLGSGSLIKKAIKKYGKDNFDKKILMFFPDINTMNSTEKMIVDENFISRICTYNRELGGSGGKNWTQEMKENMSRIKKEKYKSGECVVWNKGKTDIYSEETKEKMRRNHADVSGKNNPMYGRNCEYKMSPEEIKNTEKI